MKSGECRLTIATNPDMRKGKTATVEHPIFQCQGVTKRFDGTTAVDDVSLTLESGEIMALVGPSGCGKTTFLRLVAGFDTPDSGTISLKGQVLAGPGRWVPPEARRVGMVFQDYALFPHLTVLQNVAYGLKGWAADARDRRAHEMLDVVRLTGFDERHPHQLSGGEQQRVALARSLAPHPLALLLDEPFSNLDPHLRWQLRSEVRDILRSSGVSAIYVTHDQDEALFLGDKVAVMDVGKVEQVSVPEEIFHHPSTRFVGRYLGIAHFISARATEDGLTTEMGTLQPQVSLSHGREVVVMVRPDDVAISPSDGGTGRVTGQVFQGTHYLYAISLPSGDVVHSLQHHTVQYKEGDAVDVRFEANQTLTCFVDESEPPLESGWSFPAVTAEKP